MAPGHTLPTVQPFLDRVDAGRRLSSALEKFRGDDVVVLGLPRGGVPVAAEVARALGAPLDVIVVRKLGLPMQPEVAMGAIGEGGAEIIDRQLIDRARVSQGELHQVERRERQTLEARRRTLRGGREPIDLHGRTALVVDDGLATGATARAACQAARQRGASKVVLAVPVGPVLATTLIPEADEVICLRSPRMFSSVGQHYVDFGPTADEEVKAILDGAATRMPAIPSRVPTGGRDTEIEIPVAGLSLKGHLRVPAACRGVVVFAHGSGSSRASPRNRFVATILESAGIGTLLLDLLTPAEEVQRENVFDVRLLSRRLSAAVQWVRTLPETAVLPIGLFGASTGAAAALLVAADPAMDIRAVVSRGGRPDLAGASLSLVTAPTLLLVGGADPVVLGLNKAAQQQLGGPSHLHVVPGATHLFEEPGALAAVAGIATSWFREHLTLSTDSEEGVLHDRVR